MKLKNLIVKTIPYVSVATLALSLVACGSNDKDVPELGSTTIEETQTDDFTEKDSHTGKSGFFGGLSDRENNDDDATSSNVADGENETTVIGNSDSNDNSGNSNSSGNGNTSKPNGNTGSSGNKTSQNTGGSSNEQSTTKKNSSSGNSSSGNTGNSGSNSTGNGNTGSGSNSSSSSSKQFVEYKYETTIVQSSSKVDANTTKYVANEVKKTYELYSDGSKVLLDDYTTSDVVAEMSVTVKTTDVYTYVNMDFDHNGYYPVSQIGGDMASIYNKWFDKNFSINKTTYSTNSSYCTRKSDNKKFVDEKALLADNAAIALVKELKLNDTSISKEKRLFTLLKWMDENVTYNTSGTTSYDCLVNKNAKCHGYAIAICHLLSYTDIPTLYVGAPELNHAWNIVQLDDGNWYHIDGGRGVNTEASTVYEIGSNTVSLDSSKPYLILDIEIVYTKLNICSFDKIYQSVNTPYTKSIKYANRNNISLNYPVIDTTENGKYIDGRVYIKGSDLTH